jgi:hypothetical protein
MSPHEVFVRGRRYAERRGADEAFPCRRDASQESDDRPGGLRRMLRIASRDAAHEEALVGRAGLEPATKGL